MLPLCSLNRCILFSVFYVLSSGVINDDDDDNSASDCLISLKSGLNLILSQR